MVCCAQLMKLNIPTEACLCGRPATQEIEINNESRPRKMCDECTCVVLGMSMLVSAMAAFNDVEDRYLASLN